MAALKRRDSGGLIGVALRFWRFVDRSGGPEACWPWRGGQRGRGYGAFRVGRRLESAYRVSWILTYGPIPEWASDVLHSCDNPICVNPEHLYVGTSQLNAWDCLTKDRQAAGEAHGQHVLTGEQVVAIRSLAEDGLPVAVLAETFRVTAGHVRALSRGQRWNSGRGHVR